MTSIARSTARATPRRRRRSRVGRAWARSRIAYLFLLPGLALYVWFVLQPTLSLFAMSLTKWDGLAPVPEWVGLSNFQALFADPIFWVALRNNLLFVVLLVAFNLTLGLLTAAVLARTGRGRLIYQLIFFLPVVQASIVTALVWEWLYNPDGLVNGLLRAVGLDTFARGWLGDPATALPALALAAGWAGFGLSVVIFLAGIQGIDQSLYDAGKVDGASTRQLFLNVTVPQLRPVITVVILLEMIGAFQTFDIIWATTKGGPFGSTEVLSTFMFKQGFTDSQFGYGAAIAVTFMVIILIAAVGSIAVRGRNED
jgi:raffinose/stachyose/melibiose transport system permease protein